jgi:uncharacterized cupin superfamily protein
MAFNKRSRWFRWLKIFFQKRKLFTYNIYYTFPMRIRIEQNNKEKLAQQGVFGWPIWTCEPSKFDWHYDQEESCYILEGEITVKTKYEEVTIGPGDYVTFPRGLDCTWTVTKPVRKHFTFR